MCSRVLAKSSLPEKLEFLAPLLGTWKGKGQGNYPTIKPFSFLEETQFSNNGKPFISYVQKTKSEGGEPMHTETGYIRVRDDNGSSIIEFLVNDPTGVSSIFDGKVEENTDSKFTVKFTSTNVQCTPSAKPVTNIERSFTVEKSDTPKLTANLEKEYNPPLLVSLEEFDAMSDDEKCVIDVRELGELENGVVPGSYHCPLGQFIVATVKPGSEWHDRITSGKKIILYCASAGRSKIATNVMRTRGHNQVYSLAVGYKAWKDAQ